MRTKISISTRPINPAEVFRAVSNKQSGGLVFFIGTVRSPSGGKRVDRLSIESAEDLAKDDIERICDRVKKRFAINDVAVVHRIGDLKVGDVIVAIAVGAAHRRSAFKACEFIIDELKKTTPIWKKEIGRGAERWV